MFKYIIELISLPFISESITQRQKTSKLSGIMMVPLSSLLGGFIGVVIFKTGLPYIPWMIACAIISLVTGLIVGVHYTKGETLPSKLAFGLVGIVYPVSFTLGLCLLLFVTP